MDDRADLFAKAKAETQAIYERQAGYWDGIRDSALYEKPWLDRFLATLPDKARLLDLGCGSGVPIAGYLLDQGHDLVGVDYAPAMIALARDHYPAAEWLVQDMTRLNLAGGFDGIFSWDGFFHLAIAEQRAVLPQLAALIHPGGALLLTVGTGEGEVTGTVGGETVYHASLAPDEYQAQLRQCGFETVTYVAEDPDCRNRSILFASGKSA